MTALEYMERQLRKHARNYELEANRGASKQVTDNILAKIKYYAEAISALEKVGNTDGKREERL